MIINKQFLILLFVVFFGFLGAAMPYPIFAPLFLHPEHGGLISTEWSSTARTIFFGLTLAAYPFGQFIGTPILGSLSDQLGRKKLLITSMLGTGICYALSGLAIHLGFISLLVISRLLTGFLEGNLAIAQASIADLAISKHKGFGAISAMSSLGYVFGPLLGGALSDTHLISWFNLSLPFYIACGIAVFAAINMMFFIRETLKQHPVIQKPIAEQFNIFKRFATLANNITLKWLLLSGFFLYLAIDAYYEFYPALLVARWQMGPAQIAIYNVVLSIALTIGFFWLPLFFIGKAKTYNGLLLMILIFPIAFAFMLVTHNSNFVYLQFIIIGLSYGAASTLHTVLVSDSATNDQQGEVLGVLWGLRMLGDSLNCVFGGLIMILSVILPLVGAIIFAFISLLVLYKKFSSFTHNKVR